MPNKPNPNDEFLLNTLLKSVSRSFFLTLKVLPSSSRLPISLAYLLARAADTIADTSIIPAQKRLIYLNTLDALLTNTNYSLLKPIISELEHDDSDKSERLLMQHLPDIYACYQACSKPDQDRIAHVVSTLISGMRYDLETFPSETSGDIIALNNLHDLDRYTYLVAGCVGEFWTDICFDHEPHCQHWHINIQKERGVRLGKALQLTNILRDVAEDLRIGRCYLPQTQLEACGLKPQDLLLAEQAKKAKPILDHWTNEALAHFDAGADYAMTLPRHALRLRLAVFWPMLIGLATLRQLNDNPNWLCPDTKIKVSRRWVYKMLLMSLPLAASNRLMRMWLNRLHRDVKNQITHNILAN